jgi:hypothetical protein
MYSLGQGENCQTNPNKCFDFGQGLEPYKDASNGPYTHYVNNSGACTDSGNTYGSPSNPRCKIPTVVPEGSVVEIHGNYAGNFVNMNFMGTKQKPIFVRGQSETNRPVFSLSNGIIRVGGSYFIIENIVLNATSIVFHYSFLVHDHISIRNIEAYGQNSGILVGDNRYSVPASHIVIYNNYIHDTAVDLKGDSDTPSGIAGIVVASNSNHVWVLDNHVRGTGQDSFHSGHGGVNISHVYVGRNEFHHDKENAIDLKAVKNYIISQNKVYGYRKSCSSNGDAIRINDEGEQDNIWIIFNEIYDSDLGIVPDSADFRPYIIGNLIYDINHYAILDNGNINNGSTVVHNTIQDAETGINQVKECANNLLSNTTIPISGNCNASHNLISNNELLNAPGKCFRIGYFYYHHTNATLFMKNGKTAIKVDGQNFEALGVRPQDRISIERVPELQCANGCVDGGSSTKPICGWLRIENVVGDELTLTKNISCENDGDATNVEIKIWYYPYWQNPGQLYLDPGHGLKPGDNIEVNYGGVVYPVTEITENATTDYDGNWKDKITFSGNVLSVEPDLSVCNWLEKTNPTRNFNLVENSAAIDNGTYNAVYQIFNQTFYDDFLALNSVDQLNILKDIIGVTRPQDGHNDGTVEWDIGAYEYHS